MMLVSVLAMVLLSLEVGGVTITCPDARYTVINAPYSAFVTASDGTLPYSFTLDTPLPDGLTLSEDTGAVVGTPTLFVDTSYQVRVTDMLANSVSRTCLITVVPKCDDGSVCTQDALNPQTGVCTYAPIVCNDNDMCTNDSCDEVIGCRYTPLPPDACSDGDICTSDTCDPLSGCIHTALNFSQVQVVCNDGSACTTSTCQANSCEYNPIMCDDGNICTNDSCSQVSGCLYTPLSAPKESALCNDNNLCTTDTCSVPDGFCKYTESVNCPPNDACTTYSCNPLTGVCDANVTVCDDGDICTTDTCNATVGCVFTPTVPVSCDDDDVCTTDSCSGNACTFTPISCSDSNACTIDTCNPTQGCTYQPIQCNDNNPCTNDSCSAGSGCSYTPVTCPPSDACTTYACNPSSGACTATPTVCDDDNLCTTDSCSPPTGCTYTPVACQVTDVCNIAFCNVTTGGCEQASIICDDGSICTDDSCVIGVGCTYVPITPSTASILGPAELDIGCGTTVTLAAVAPTVGTGVWAVVEPSNGAFIVGSNTGPDVSIEGITTTIEVEFRVALEAGCPLFSRASVTVKRYSSVSGATAVNETETLGCQSSFYLTASTPTNGVGVWEIREGSGSISDTSNPTSSVTSVSTVSNKYTWTVSAPECVSSSVTVTVTRTAENSPECVGCTVVQTGTDANGNATFANTCDPPVPVVVNTTTPVTFVVPVQVTSLQLEAGSELRVETALSVQTDLTLQVGSKLAVIGNNSGLVVTNLNAGNSSISITDGASLAISGSLSSDGAVLNFTAGNVTVQGSLTFGNASAVELSEASSLIVEGQISFSGLLKFILLTLIEGVTPRNRLRETTVVQVASYGSSEGQFERIEVSSAECTTVSSSQPSYGATTLSLAVDINPDNRPECRVAVATGETSSPSQSGGGLSTGAIIGIAIGSVLVLFAIALIIILPLHFKRRQDRQKQMFRKVAMTEM